MWLTRSRVSSAQTPLKLSPVQYQQVDEGVALQKLAMQMRDAMERLDALEGLLRDLHDVLKIEQANIKALDVRTHRQGSRSARPAEEILRPDNAYRVDE